MTSTSQRRTASSTEAIASSYSIAFFFDLNPEAEVAVIPSCVAKGERARYAQILAADYLKFRLDASKPAGLC